MHYYIRHINFDTQNRSANSGLLYSFPAGLVAGVPQQENFGNTQELKIKTKEGCASADIFR